MASYKDANKPTGDVEPSPGSPLGLQGRGDATPEAAWDPGNPTVREESQGTTSQVLTSAGQEGVAALLSGKPSGGPAESSASAVRSTKRNVQSESGLTEAMLMAGSGKPCQGKQVKRVCYRLVGYLHISKAGTRHATGQTRSTE